MTQENDAIKDRELRGDDVSADDAAGDTPEQQAPVREPTEREKRLAEIAREHEASYATAEEAPEEEPGNEQDADQDDGEDDPEEAAAEADPLEGTGYYRNAQGQLVTTVKVNGQEREVTAEQMKAYLQKDLAGDYKLQQAAERERQLRAKEQELLEREQQKPSQPSTTKLDAEESERMAKDVLARLWDGDDDAASKALSEYIQRTSATVDPDQIAQIAEQRAQAIIEQREAQQHEQSWNQSVSEGNQWLRETHGDIYQDPRKFNMVNAETERMVNAQQAGDPEFANLTPRQIIERAAKDTQAWLKEEAQRLSGSADGGREAPEATAQSARQQRKDGLKPMPRGMSKQPTQKQPKEVDTSPAAAIERMRASRAVTP